MWLQSWVRFFCGAISLGFLRKKSFFSGKCLRHAFAACSALEARGISLASALHQALAPRLCAAVQVNEPDNRVLFERTNGALC